MRLADAGATGDVEMRASNAPVTACHCSSVSVSSPVLGTVTDRRLGQGTFTQIAGGPQLPGVGSLPIDATVLLDQAPAGDQD